MKGKKLVIIGAIALCIITVGCGKKETTKASEKEKDPIVGKWALGSFVYTFNADGTCQYDAAGTIMKCTYKTDGDKLSILYDGNTVSFDTTYSIDGNKLNVKDSFGNDTIYTKK